MGTLLISVHVSSTSLRDPGQALSEPSPALGTLSQSRSPPPPSCQPGSDYWLGIQWRGLRCSLWPAIGTIENLVELDDPAIGVGTEELMPALDRPLAHVAVGDSLGVEARPHRRDVVDPEGQVADGEWVDRQTIAL